MKKYTDVLIVGSGLAGLFTALNIDKKHKITIISKTELDHSNSILAQGGIACEFNDDKALHQSHIDDTMKAGDYLNDEKAVKFLVDNAYESVKNLVDLGVKFDIGSDNKFLTTREGGHTTKRIFHSGGDATGREVTSTLINLILEKDNIEILENTMALDIIKKDGKAVGCVLLENNENAYLIYAKKIILATGGIGSVYNSTTNDLTATGDGIGMAKRAGAKLQNMEFVQFHPTALYSENNFSRHRFLITEALRGEGAYLVNIEKERFMNKYDPVRMELAPRDVVSQAIYREMYDTWTDHVYLDTRHLDPKFLEKRFPTVFSHCKKEGYILGMDLVPVAPCEHFLCGGIASDLNGRTTLDNLYAVGEVAYTGVHGANRLASNSLLECLVFGLAAARDIDKNMPDNFEENGFVFDNIPQYSYNYKPLRKKMGDYMDEHVSIVRNQMGLELTEKVLTEMFYNLDRFPNMTRYYYETLNLITTALEITKSALKRKESIGCHLLMN